PDVAQQALHGPDDALEDLVVHDPGHPPGALRPHLVANHVPVVAHRLRGEPDGLIEQRLMAIVGEDEREGLAERGRDARRAEPGAHNFVDQHPHVLVGERLEGLRETARDLASDAPAVLRVGEPPSGPLGGPHRPQVGRDDFARQEVILHEGAQDPADPLLAGGHGGGESALPPHADRSARESQGCGRDALPAAASAALLSLIAAIPGHSLAGVFEGRHLAVVQVHTAPLAAEWVRDVRPDTIVIDAELPDMSGIDACRLLHSDPRIGHTVPTLILAPNKPTPEQRVAALRAGVWDFVLYPPDPEELLLSLETYLQAKRNIDVALAGLMDPATGLHTRPALARRARELGALMSRARGGLACVVFALDADPADPKAGSILVRSARVSDVVGALSPTEFAVLAPGTDQAGAVKLAQRIGGALRDVVGASGSSAAARA